MAGVLPTEGEEWLCDLVLEQATQAETDRGSTMVICLFTNNINIDDSVIYAGLTQPTSAGGYALTTIPNNTWSGSTGSRTATAITFEATGADYSSDTVYGYFVATDGTNKKVIAVEKDVAPVDINNGDSYTITPTISFN